MSRTIEWLERENMVLAAQVAKMRDAAEKYFSWAGATHEIGCPEDDTCDCSHIIPVNEVFRDDNKTTTEKLVSAAIALSSCLADGNAYSINDELALIRVFREAKEAYEKGSK